MHEVRTLKALQTGMEAALSKYLFYEQLGGQKGSKGRESISSQGLVTFVLKTKKDYGMSPKRQLKADPTLDCCHKKCLKKFSFQVAFLLTTSMENI